jgi:hypothetical protein
MRTTPLVLSALLLFGTTATVEAQSRRARKDLAPAQGKPAPDFELFQLQADGSLSKKKVKLSSFKGKQPVALVFGSYT